MPAAGYGTPDAMLRFLDAGFLPAKVMRGLTDIDTLHGVSVHLKQRS